MPIDTAAALDRLKQFDFSGLFTQDLGWDFPPANTEVSVGGKPYALQRRRSQAGVRRIRVPRRARQKLDKLFVSMTEQLCRDMIARGKAITVLDRVANRHLIEAGATPIAAISALDIPSPRRFEGGGGRLPSRRPAPQCDDAYLRPLF